MKKIYKLQPVFKEYIWGGTKLKEDFNFETNLETVSEAWVLSGHKEAYNPIEDSYLNLRVLVKKYRRALLGTKSPLADELPLLIKFIDAKEDLSIQVHPNDKQAQAMHEEFGKTEMWYILDTEENNTIVLGPKEKMGKKELKEAIKSNTLEDYLHYAPIEKGDSVMIEAGTIHAICANTSVIEVQQSSDTTFRLYDYNRQDKDGKTRDLHIKESIEVSNLEPQQENFKREVIVEDGIERKVLEEHEYFKVQELTITNSYSFETSRESFVSIVLLEGNLKIKCEEESLDLKKGDSVLLPAQQNIYGVIGKAKILLTRL